MPSRRSAAAVRKSDAAGPAAGEDPGAAGGPAKPGPPAARPRRTVKIQLAEDATAESSGESDEDAASPATKDAFNKASFAPRRRGLSTVERVCFQKSLVLSPRAQEKFSANEGRRLTAYFGDDPVGDAASNAESPSAVSPRSRGFRHRATCFGRAQLTIEPPVERSGFDVEADKVAVVLGQIFPSTRETPKSLLEAREKAALLAMATPPPQPSLSRARGTVLCVNTPVGKSGLISPPAFLSSKTPTSAVAKGGAFHRAAARTSVSQRDSTLAAGKLAKSPGAAAAATDKGNRESRDGEDIGVEADGTPAIEKSRLKRSLAILRKENRIGVDEGSDLPLSHMLKDVDPAARPLFENAILMSKFTAAGGLKRETNGSGFSLRVEVPRAPEAHHGRSWRRTGGVEMLQKATRKVELMNSLGDGRVQLGSDKGEEQFSLREFRRRLLKQFGSVHGVFNHIDADMSEELDASEWEKAMLEAQICNSREAHLMFELLDASDDGMVSITEFQVGVETIAPINSLESFRKRLLCLGFRTMTQAVKLMESAAGEGTIRQPLTFYEFSNALRRVYIFDPTEASVLYEAISDPVDESGRVSIGDVAAALGMVSPSFLLEELRERVLTRNSRGQEIWKSLFSWIIRGGVEEEERRKLQALLDRPHVQALLEKWWTAQRYKDIAVADTLLAELKALGMDVQLMRPPGTEIDEFVSSTVDQLGFTPAQAEKAFRLVDIDGNGELEMAELLSAMNLAMPCVKTEDIRHVIRQRHRSIHSALSAASDMQLVGTSVRSNALDNEVMFTPSELSIFLETLDMNTKDVLRIFQLVDARGDGSLTLWQFFKGLRIFAPTCMLEGIRLQLLANHGRIATAFSSDAHQDRTEPLEFKEMAELLLRLGVRCDDVDMTAIFDCLDARNVGTVTVSEMTAAFQNLVPGSRERVGVYESERKAERSVRAELAGVRKNVNELRSNVRQGLEEEPKVAQAAAKRSTAKTAARSAGRLRGGKAGGEDEGRMPHLERPSAAELAAVQYEARKMLGKVVSCPELRRRPREQRDPEEPPLELPPLDSGKQGTGPEAAGDSKTRWKPGGGHGRAATNTFDRIRSNVKKLPPHQIQRVQLNFEPLAGYFTSASETLEDHMPLLEVRRTRGELHSEIARHVTAARLKVK